MRHAVTQKELTHQASERWDSEDWPQMKGGTRNLAGRSVSLQCGAAQLSCHCLAASFCTASAGIIFPSALWGARGLFSISWPSPKFSSHC